jgi:site-specific DNA recombinase
MMKTITKVLFPPVLERRTRVAAYARVSSGKDAMLHSLSAQVGYYSAFIQKHSGWEYAGVYADEALTGTKEDRDEFQHLLSECRAGHIDMVITKSISRFARNTVTLLETVRELKGLGVDVYFEEQNIHTQSSEGELMMTILASYAQEESLSASENQKWRIRHSFEDGRPWNCTMLGYRNKDGVLTVVPEEAETVRTIFNDYLSGMGVVSIANKLNKAHVPTRLGGEWCKTGVSKLLRNRAYTGDLLLQTTYRDNYLTKQMHVNNGEMPMYRVESSHEAIVDSKIFEAVQLEMALRAKQYAHVGPKPGTYPFTGMIVCGNCGKRYLRKITHGATVWICPTFSRVGKAACASKAVPESVMFSESAAALGLDAFDKDIFIERVDRVEVQEPNHLQFVFTDGRAVERVWQDRSRAESWTPEMKETARQKALGRGRATK